MAGGVCAELRGNTCMRGAQTSGGHAGVANASSCCSLCTADATCAAFTYKVKGGHASCIFHPAAVPTQPGDCTSAAVRGPHPPSPPPPSPPSPPPAPPAPAPPAPPSPKPSAKPQAEQRNVLHVIVDDLRPQLGAYGRHDMHTPHVDALAAKSMVFDRAYVQVALCGPTRTSFLTGRRPDASRTFDFANNFRESSPGIPGVGDKWQPLPEIFRNSGTHLSLGTGKVCTHIIVRLTATQLPIYCIWVR